MNQAFWVPVGIAIAFGLFRRFVPTKPPAIPGPPLTDAERATYRRWEVAALIPFFIFAPALTFLWFLLLRAIAHLFIGSPEAVYIITPSNAYWALPAMFLGIVTSVFPMTWLYKALLRERFESYMRASTERAGFDGMAVLKGLGVMIAAATGVFLVCGVNSVTLFKEREMRIGHALSFRAATYSYAGVAGVLHRSSFRAPNGKLVFRPHYVIQFSDGSEWSTREGLRDPDPTLDDRVAQFVAAKSGQAIRED